MGQADEGALVAREEATVGRCARTGVSRAWKAATSRRADGPHEPVMARHDRSSDGPMVVWYERSNGGGDSSASQRAARIDDCTSQEEQGCRTSGGGATTVHGRQCLGVRE